MMRRDVIGVFAVVGLLLLTQSLAAQGREPKASPKTKEEKIQNAMSAAPKAVA
jgi:hypothetical protein